MTCALVHLPVDVRCLFVRKRTQTFMDNLRFLEIIVVNHSFTITKVMFHKFHVLAFSLACSFKILHNKNMWKM